VSYASLHAGMLVRKGEAAPSTPERTDAILSGPDDATRWLVQRRDVPPPEPPPAPPKVQDLLGRGLIEFAQTQAGRPRRNDAPVLRVVSSPSIAPEAPPPSPEKRPRPRRDSAARVVLTLKPEQARRLNLAAARLDKPRARLLAQALDALLDDLATGDLEGCSCYRGLSSDGVCCGA
jgi:hypothetical protein